MSENSEKENAKREIDYCAPVREFDNKTNLITNIGFTAKSDTKYQILWEVPTTDEECQKRYDCSLAVLIEAGIRQFSTRPNYRDVGFYIVGDTLPDGTILENDIGSKRNPVSSHEDFGSLKPEGHEAMQVLADGYQVGQRATGSTQKVMAQKAKAAEAELGMTMEEMVAEFKILKEKGLLDR